ncbi:NGDN [Branchiostoma lanceolatum]|uniref:NGDN protein n=1 Tax=Branchiostoma lanceolatum TaxID=7740 RepID=A0A8K0A594_BRALA|nr:NGDN [Branchiostoma lanceolatum]
MADDQVIAQDLPKAMDILNDIKTQMDSVTGHAKGLLKKVKDGDISTAKGISFLESKYQLLLSYLINLTYIMMRKVEGASIRGDPAVSRIVEIRTYLEKMRPIDHKLKYQVDKLVKMAAMGELSENDPLRFKPNPDNLTSKLDESEEESEAGDEEKDTGKSKVYVPPKLAPMHYDEDTPVQKQQKKEEQARKRALRSSLIRELKEAHSDAPQEIRDSVGFRRSVETQDDRHQREYEEDYFVRLAVSKKQKRKQSMGMVSTLNQITKFGDTSALFGGDGASSSKKRKRTSSKKGKKGAKKGFKKRRK